VAPPRGPYAPRSPLAHHRAARRLTLEQAAAALGISREHLNRVERGAVRASSSLRRRLAALYGLRELDVTRMLSIVNRLAVDRLSQFVDPRRRRRRRRSS
jgi:transcriptional regulator with XRE-family HTH domain